jgi:hypothetical protein
VDGDPRSGDYGTPSITVFVGYSFRLGTHSLLALITKDGVQYAKEVIFKVVN